MDWNSRRITAILENALLEDRATSDATSYACVEPNQRADLRLCGLNLFLLFPLHVASRASLCFYLGTSLSEMDSASVTPLP